MPPSRCAARIKGEPCPSLAIRDGYCKPHAAWAKEDRRRAAKAAVRAAARAAKLAQPIATSPTRGMGPALVFSEEAAARAKTRDEP